MFETLLYARELGISIKEMNDFISSYEDNEKVMRREKLRNDYYYNDDTAAAKLAKHQSYKEYWEGILLEQPNNAKAEASLVYHQEQINRFSKRGGNDKKQKSKVKKAPSASAG